MQSEPILPRKGTPVPTGSRSVLVVDDYELVRETLAETLLLLGHRVDLAVSGEDALELLSEGAVPDMVVLDLNMPGLGGRETLLRLRELLPGARIVLSTGQQDASVVALAHRWQARLLPKPYTLEQLRAALQATGSVQA